MQLIKFKNLLEKDKYETNLFIENHHIEIDHTGDETDAIQAKILARAAAQIVARKRDKLIKIDFALKKIANGSFGICEACEEPIAEKRLAFNPSFNQCVSCSERADLLKRGLR